MLNVFIIPRGLPERKKNFWPGGAELAVLLKSMLGSQRIKVLTGVGGVAKVDECELATFWLFWQGKYAR